MVTKIEIIDKATPKLQKLNPRLKQELGKKLLNMAIYGQIKALEYAYENAIYSKTRNLASSIRFDVNTAKGTAIIRADRRVASYANIVEIGAKPHPIPNAFGKGITVMHPGMKGKLYMRKAGYDIVNRFSREIKEGIDLTIKDVWHRS